MENDIVRAVSVACVQTIDLVLDHLITAHDFAADRGEDIDIPTWVANARERNGTTREALGLPPHVST